jgi:hypothetical protein
VGKPVADAVAVGAGVDVEVIVQVGDAGVVGVAAAVGIGFELADGVGMAWKPKESARPFGFSVVAVGDAAGATVGAITAPARYAAARSRVRLR